MKDILVLIDYHNLPTIVRGRPMNHKDHENSINYITDKLIEYTSATYSNSRIVQRYYGGWYDENGKTTDDRDLVATVLRKTFPTAIRKNRFIAGIADGPLGSDITLSATVRIEPGLPSFSVYEKPENCECKPCGLEALMSWKKGRCPYSPTCAKKDSNVAYTRNQKVVDTLIVGDALYSFFNTDNQCIIISNDDDMLPSILYGSDRDRMTILRPGRKKPSYYDHLIEDGYKIVNI
jgi:hypothetical protein